MGVVAGLVRTPAWKASVWIWTLKCLSRTGCSHAAVQVPQRPPPQRHTILTSSPLLMELTSCPIDGNVFREELVHHVRRHTEPIQTGSVEIQLL